MDVNRPSFEHCSANVPGWDDRPRFEGRNRSKLSRQSQRVAIDEVDLDVIGAAKPGRSLGNRIKDGLQIGWGTGYDTQDLARGNLPLQRIFRLVEQPDILDSDHRLVGEGLEQSGLVVGEAARVGARD